MNPYVYDRPLVRREQFYDRDSEKVRIYSRIAADRPQSVSIVGEPRMGKTSFLNWLYHEDSRAEHMDDPSAYVYVLLSLKEQPPGDPAAFFGQVGEALQRMGQGPMVPSYEGFRHMVERLMGEGKRLVLFCDDFGWVTQNRAFPLEFFSFMRSVANNHNVAYVTTSSVALQMLCSSQALEESPFFNIFATLILRPFSEEDARALIREPARAAGVSLEDEVDWMVELAGVIPYLLQLTACLAFDAQINGKLQSDEVGEHAFRESRAFLHLLWEAHFSPAEQAVLRVICGGQGVTARHGYAAEELERRGHLQRVGDGYAIRSGLLRRFVEASLGRGFWRRLFR